MRPLSSSRGSEVRLWKSPNPYLFGGLAIMLALISIALVVLICSYRKRASSLSQSSSSAGEDNIKQAMPKNPETESEPKVLVIMAGDHNPTYLAKPTSSAFCTSEAEPTPSVSSSSSSELSSTN